MIVLGVDPGGQNVGLVVRYDDTLAWHRLLARAPGMQQSSWLATVIRELGDGISRAVEAIGASTLLRMNWSVRIAVEDVRAPGGFAGGKRAPINLSGLIDTAQVLGAILGRWPGAIVVPPGRHGQGPREAFPAELWGAREGRAGTGRLRHVRSAWDVAGAAVLMLRRTAP